MRSSACDTACPVLCPVRALLARVPLGPRPSLHRLPRGRDRFVRRLPSYYGRVSLLATVHHPLRLLAFPIRTGGGCRTGDRGVPPFPRKDRPPMPRALTPPERP